MPQAKFELHADAEFELDEAFEWYRARSSSAARVFVQEIERGLMLIAETPDAWPPFEGKTRRFLVPGYPFSIIYRLERGDVEIIAIAHHKRRPGYWRSR